MKNGFTIKEILEICNAKLLGSDENIICQSFTNDTRTISQGDTYVGIKGTNFDGNAFYQEAFNLGANCVILEEEYVKNHNILSTQKPIIVVSNSITAIGMLAKKRRNQTNAKVIGVTGSVGKTSTRDIIYSLLKEESPTLKTQKNFNNDIGLPLTLLRLKEEKYAVIEMGMNHLNEIDYLTKIAQPDIGIITNVGTAHIGELKSRENILKAKLEIINGINLDGYLIVNNDNDLLHKFALYYHQKPKLITIGIDNESTFMATNIKLGQNSSTFTIKYNQNTYEVTSPIAGRVYIYNCLIAFAVGILVGINVDKIILGIEHATLSKGRLETRQTNGYTIINDAYNASVDSMKSSIDILSNYHAKRRIAILGDMLELGTYTKKLHEEVGKYVAEKNIDYLITIGDSAKYIAQSAKDNLMDAKKIKSFNTNDEALVFLKKNLNKEDVVLFKASNRMNFNNIISKL